MPHYCRICHSDRPNEAFSGHGHKIHICKRCRRMPAHAQQRIQRLDELHGYLQQSHISEKNLMRLSALAADDDATVRERAHVLLELGVVAPYRRRRFRRLAREHRHLLTRYNVAWYGTPAPFGGETYDAGADEWPEEDPAWSDVFGEGRSLYEWPGWPEGWDEPSCADPDADLEEIPF